MTEINSDEDVERFFGPYKKWFQFGLRSPAVLWKRMHSQHPWLSPIREIKYGMQRWRRGWSDRDTWGFDYYLARVIAEGTSHMREIAHGYPADFSEDEGGFEKWMKILEEIEYGMRASIKIMDDWLPADAPEYEQFSLAMEHLDRWWFSLWD